MAAKYPNADLVACGQREVAMREKCYPSWEKKQDISECSEKRQQEHAMMQAIVEQLIALPELLARYQNVKDVLRDMLPQPYTYDSPKEGTLVLVYCTNSDRPYLAQRTGLNEWRFEDNRDDIVMDGLDSQQVIAFSYLPTKPKIPTNA